MGFAAAAIGLGLFLWVFFDVRNVFVYCAILLVGGYLAYRRMNTHETPFERREREARRMRM
jgi:hypothetical protein